MTVSRRYIVLTYWMSILMGILQGIAEFLPISSSGHLALFQHFFAMENVEESQMFFTVLLHFATLIAVCVYYWQDIIDMIREFFLGIRDLASRGRRGREKLPPARRLVLLIIVATLPLFVVLPVKDLVEGLSGNIYFVAGALIVTGFLLFASDRVKKDARRSGAPSCWMCCWWALLRPSLPAPASPAPAPLSPPAALWALTGSLRCAFPSCCPSLPSWGPTS